MKPRPFHIFIIFILFYSKIEHGFEIYFLSKFVVSVLSSCSSNK